MAVTAQQLNEPWVRVTLPQGVPIPPSVDASSSSLFAHVAPLRVLRAIKRAHVQFPVQWQKHINDYHVLKRATEDDGYGKAADGKGGDGSSTETGGFGVTPAALEAFRVLRYPKCSRVFCIMGGGKDRGRIRVVIASFNQSCIIACAHTLLMAATQGYHALPPLTLT